MALSREAACKKEIISSCWFVINLIYNIFLNFIQLYVFFWRFFISLFAIAALIMDMNYLASKFHGKPRNIDLYKWI